jgi:YVTN family beta-propeller protein
MRAGTLALSALLVLAAVARDASAARLLVLNKADANVSFFDPDSGEVVATVPVGRGPHEAAVSPDGATAVVCNYGEMKPGSSLTVIDVAKAEVVRTIELGEHQRPHGIEFLPDGKRIAVTTEVSKNLIVVDVESGEITATVGTDQQASHMVALAPDGKRAFVANIASGSVSVIDLADGKLEKVVPTGAGAEGIAITPDGAEVWVTNRAADTVTVLDAATLESKGDLAAPTFPIRAKVTPDGKHVLVSCAESGDVVVFDRAGRKELRRIGMLDAGRGADYEPVPIGILIEPSGKRAYIANAGADEVAVIDLETWTVVKRLRTGKQPDGMAWAA